MTKTIIEDGVRVYLNHFCEHCGKRIPWNKWHKYRGIPSIIHGHNAFFKDKQLSEEHKNNIAKSMTGKTRNYSKEHNKKISKALKGRERPMLELINSSLSNLINASIRKGEIEV